VSLSRITLLYGVGWLVYFSSRMNQTLMILKSAAVSNEFPNTGNRLEELNLECVLLLLFA
jgi:hypothetical protein